MCPLSARLAHAFSRSRMGRTHEPLKRKKEKGKKSMFAYLITGKENRKKAGRDKNE
jgi:hypothetical protein